MTAGKAILCTILLGIVVVAVLAGCLFIRNEHINLCQVILNTAGLKYIVSKICDFGDWLMKSKGDESI